jgi:uncharacterized protein (DUF2267 family)
MTSTLALPVALDSPIADLLLVRMALPTPTPKKVRHDVGKLLHSELSTTEFERLRDELASAGLLSKGRRNTFVLTDAGRERALQFLGVSEFPLRTNWSGVISRYLLPKATALPAESAAKLDTGDKLAAYVLRRKYGLPAFAGSTVRRVLEALACRELGFSGETTLEGVLCAVLSKLIGAEERLSKELLARQVPLFETGLVKMSADAVRLMLVRDWLTGTPARRSPAEPFDLSTFAATVRALAGGSPPDDRFHDNKVFIAPLWRASQREPAFLRMSLPEFKQRLIEANSHNLLHLSRADLVEAMDRQLLAESEATYLNATFHFLLLEEPRP